MTSERIRGAQHMYWSALLITGVVLLIVISLEMERKRVYLIERHVHSSFQV